MEESERNWNKSFAVGSVRKITRKWKEKKNGFLVWLP